MAFQRVLSIDRNDVMAFFEQDIAIHAAIRAQMLFLGKAHEHTY